MCYRIRKDTGVPKGKAIFVWRAVVPTLTASCRMWVEALSGCEASALLNNSHAEGQGAIAYHSAVINRTQRQWRG